MKVQVNPSRVEICLNITGFNLIVKQLMKSFFQTIKSALA